MPRPTSPAEAEVKNFLIHEEVTAGNPRWLEASLWKHKSLDHVVLWFGDDEFEGLTGGCTIAYDPLTQELKQDDLP